MFKKKTWWFAVGAILLILLALNFLAFRIARSKTAAQHTLSTYRTGETLPDNMTAGFTLYCVFPEKTPLDGSLATALQTELEELTSVGTVTVVNGLPDNQGEPLLLVEVASDRLWTPFYGQATLNAQIYYAYDGDAPWPLDEPVEFRVSPAVKADGSFTVDDKTWGLISKKAYSRHLARALVEEIAIALEDDVFSRS